MFQDSLGLHKNSGLDPLCTVYPMRLVVNFHVVIDDRYHLLMHTLKSHILAGL